jgi:hypothetical protein
MTRSVRHAALLIAAACLAGLVACSDDAAPAPAPPEPVATAAVEEGLAGLFAGDRPDGASSRSGACFADALLERVTPDDLRDGSVLDEQYAVRAEVGVLPPALAGSWADAQLACTDFVAESTRAQVAVTKGRLETTTYADCLGARLDPEAVRRATVASLTAAWDDPAITALSDAQTGCAHRATPRD